MNLQELKIEFLKRFPGGAEEIRFFTAPFSVNLFGEYPEYNGGYAMPTTLSMGTIIAVRPRGDRKLCMQSTERDIQVEGDIDAIDEYKGLEWGSYQLGIAGELIKQGYKVVGADMLYYDTIPKESNLSKNVSVGIATSVAMAKLGGIAEVDSAEMAKLARRAEMNYIGSDSGIIEYFASAVGRKNHAVLLNNKNLDYKLVPFKLDGMKLIISDTNKKKFAFGFDNEKRRMCEKGFAQFKKVLPSITCPGDITMAEFVENKAVIADDDIRKYFGYIVSENERVFKATVSLKKDNISMLGDIMTASHYSISDNCNIVSEEIRTLVKEAQKVNGMIGTKMAGEGCTVSIVKNEAVDAFIEKVGTGYTEKIGYAPLFYVADISDGGREIFLN